MAENLYSERSVSRTPWIVVGVLSVALWAFLVSISDSWQVAVFGGAALVAATGGIAALTLWSMGRYGDISVSAEELRIGRSRVPVGELDRDYVRALAAEASPDLRERVVRSLGTVQLPGRSEAVGGGTLLGGAYAPPAGRDVVPLLRRGDGATLLAPVKDRTRFLAALLTALGD